MAEIIVRFNGSRADVRRLVGTIPKRATGNSRVMNTALRNSATVLMNHIRTAFLVKTKGGTDQAGLRWAPLSPRTVANRSKKRPRFKGLKGARTDILIETGELLKSLTPKARNPHTVLRAGLGQVILGTSRKWARTHHKGAPKLRIPQRRLWPVPARWPHTWKQELLGTVREGIVNLIINTLARREA